MKKLLALFPNLTMVQSCTLWDIKFKGLSLPLSTASAELRVLAVWDYENDDEEKAAMRQLEVLRCHLVLAAHLTGQSPLVSCKVLIWQQGGDEPTAATSEMGVPLSFLASHLPQELEESARTVCWFVRYLEQPRENERARVFRLYNALGTLPGGFDGILEVSSKQEDAAILEMLLRRVQDFHDEDNEEENYIPQSLPFSRSELEAVESCYLRRLLELYPQFGNMVSGKAL